MKKIVIGTGISKSFGEGAERCLVLDDVSVEIEEGEFIAVMGPSGSGKSTLLYALSGMDGLSDGSVTFDGLNISKLSENELADLRRTKMGFVFQQSTMLKNLNLLDNIILPAMRGSKTDTRQIAGKAKSLMKKTGIAELAQRDITQVSGGQLQRAGICRALINDPKIIFGDEPTGALNSKSAQDIRDILMEISKDNSAVFIVTHDAKVAAHSQRILFMKDGRIQNRMELGKYSGTDIEQRTIAVTEAMRHLEI